MIAHLIDGTYELFRHFYGPLILTQSSPGLQTDGATFLPASLSLSREKEEL
jgi:hypothetical protein